MNDDQPYGLAEGKLLPCPDSPNCVCSEYTEDKHSIEPLKFTGDADTAWARLLETVKALPRTKIVSSTDEYLQIHVRTLILRFVDVLEFRLDRSTSKIQVRSASKVGYSDLGVNRRRVETIRQRFSDT